MLTIITKPIGLLLYSLLLWMTLPALAPAQDKPTNWYGELDAGMRVFRFYIAVNDGKAKLISLDEGDTEFSLDDYQIADQKVRFELKQTKASFEGTIDAASGKLHGAWTQGGAKIPFELRPVKERPTDDAIEVWGGILEAGPQKLVLQFRVYADANGEKRVLFDSLSQKTGGLKTKYREEGKKIFFECDPINAKFSGEKSEDGKVISGEFQQGSVFKLELKRQDGTMSSKAVERKRPQTPKPPFPYQSENVTFENAAANVKLAGTLTLPENRKPTHIAILISGSGPQDRDETLLEHKPFAVIADHLTRLGIGVLRYDDRGVGSSTGNYATATSRDFADDTKAAVAFIQQQPTLKDVSIGLIGHSEGGLVAPMVASEMPEIKWIILMAGPGVNGGEILLSQNKLILRAQGATERDIQQQIASLQIAFKLIQENTLSMQEMSKKWIQLVSDDLKQQGSPLSDEERAKIELNGETMLKTLGTPWMKFFIQHEPGPVLEKVRCPVLALNGEKDLQVEWELNFPKIEEALRKGGNSSIELVRLPNLNHLFQNCQTGSPIEYQNIEETLDPKVLQKMSDWIQKQPAK